MKVTISVAGKFHAFHLAEQLEKRGYLNKVFTSYPWWKIEDARISPYKLNCLILKEIIERALYKIPYLSQKNIISYYMSNFFDKQVSNRIKHCDIFIGWSGCSLFTLRKIHISFPAKVIVERCSTHIEYQRDILIEEQERLGIKLSLPFSGIVEKELKEYHEADYISLPSTFAKETFIDRGFSQEKLIQTPYGVDIEDFKSISKNDNTFRIIFVGICLRKGIHYLLQAIKELKLKDLEVWLIGRVADEVRPILKRYSDNFKYMGALPHKELYRYYSQGSVFVLPSLEEGLAHSILEAMACGLPVICSTNSGAKDVVREGIDGFVVPVRDVEALKEKISFFYQRPKVCEEMGRQARQRVESNFTWEHYGERIVNIYKSITNS